MTDKKAFGSFIKTKRLEKQYSQKDLADILFVSESAVSKWERGVSYPDITLVSEICRALEISEHELLTASTDTNARTMKQEARKFRVIRGAWFWIPTISYLTALFICLICNLAVSHTLSWFFVVFAALLCAYTFIPTFTSFFHSKKFLVFTVTSFCSICLLLLTCGAYTGTLFWVPTACIGVLIGYVLIFLPMLLSKTKIKTGRWILTFVLAFVLTVLLLISIHVWRPLMLGPSIWVTCYGFLPAFFCCIICILPYDPFIRAGVCTWLCAAAYYFCPKIVNRLFDLKDSYDQFDFHDWDQCANANIHLILLLSLLLAGAVLLATGLFRMRKSHR